MEGLGRRIFARYKGVFAMKMQIGVNGKIRTFTGPLTVRDLLRLLDVNPDIVAIEKNREILDRDKIDELPIGDGDSIEIVQIVGGGK